MFYLVVVMGMKRRQENYRAKLAGHLMKSESAGYAS